MIIIVVNIKIFNFRTKVITTLHEKMCKDQPQVQHVKLLIVSVFGLLAELIVNRALTSVLRLFHIIVNSIHHNTDSPS